MNNTRNIVTGLVLEDESFQADRLKQLVHKASVAAGAACLVECKSSVDEARKFLADGNSPNLVIIDHALVGKEDGLAFLKHLVETKTSCLVLILSSRLMKRNVLHQEIWKDYCAMAAESQAVGIQVEVREKDIHYASATAWITKAVENCVGKIPRARTIHWNALKPIIAESRPMSEVATALRAFLEEWQAGQRHVLVLHGDQSVGKRLVACCVAEAAGIGGPGGVKERLKTEQKRWSTPGVFRGEMEELQQIDLSGGAERFEFGKASGSPLWSQIIPTMHNWTDRLSLARLMAETIVRFPRSLFIWIFETPWWMQFGPELEGGLQRAMKVVGIPNFSRRGPDMARLAQELCPDLRNLSWALGKTAVSALEANPPSSPSALRVAMRVAINKCPRGAKHISGSDLPWVGTKASQGSDNPATPKEIASDCEKRVIEFLQEERKRQHAQSKSRRAPFGPRLESLSAESDKLVIRAAAYISAASTFGSQGGKTHPNQYPTIF